MKFTNKFHIFRLIALLLVVLSLAACGGKTPAASDPAGDAAALLRKADAASGSDWSAFALARWDADASRDWLETYYAAVEIRVADCGGVLHERKYTEYSRFVLAITALGKDPADVAGFDLLIPLGDFEKTVYQGVNGAIMALLALDSGNYTVPSNPTAATQATRELYLDYILAAQLPGGGWALSGDEAEIDLTAMALQALAPYREREDVTRAIETGLVILSQRQNSRGGYTAYNTDSSEAISQTIIALATLEIPLEDPRFVKDGNTLLDALLAFRQADGGFAHLLDGKTDRLATEQALLALTALEMDAPLYKIR